MKSQDLKKTGLPDKPGVYFFKKEKTILYIGKATSLRDRAKSYFGKDLIATRGPGILDMVVKADMVEWQETDSVLEALILEANLIKKYQPKYNTKEKDNKSWNYVCITKEEIPMVLIVRGRNIFSQQDPNSSRFTLKGSDTDKNLHIVSKKYKAIFGPFPNGNLLREAMKIVRRIFPYFDFDSNKKNNKEFYRQLGLVPDLITTSQKHENSSRFTPKVSYTDKNFHVFATQYKENIKNIKLLFNGNKKGIIKELKKKMGVLAKLKDFENAAHVRNQIFALNHINDVALLKEEEIYGSPTSIYRIEAYDVAHMGGKDMVGVMTVIEDGEVAKREYKKFIIRTQNDANDTGALEEVLSRRLRHSEWGLPSLIVVDGSTAQINVAKRVLNRYQFDIKVVGVVKDERHKPKAIIGDENIIKIYKKQILLSNNEAHRFSIAFHKQKRNKSFLGRISG